MTLEGRQESSGRLFRRYALWIGASVFGLMAANGVAQSYFIWRDTEAALHERHRRIADAAARRIGAVLDDAAGHMAVTLRQMEGSARLDPALRQQELYRLMRARRLFAELQLARADGSVLARAGRLVSDAGRSMPERRGEGADSAGDAWPTPGMGDAPGYGNVFLLRESEPRVRVALRGRSPGNGDAALVLLAELSLESLGTVLAELAPAPGRGAALVLLDASERVIAHSEPGRSLAALSWRHLHPATVPPPPPATLQLARDGPGGDALLSSAPVDALNAVLVLEQAHREAWSPVRESIVRSVLATGMALLLAMAVAAWLTRRMGGLFSSLTRAHDRIRDQAERMATMNTELDRRRDDAERANLAKTRFITAASHDLRQPLHTVALLSDVLQRRVRDSEERALATQLQQAVAAMDRLFAGILDLSKLDAGLVEAKREPLALSAVLERIDTQAAPLAAERGVLLHVRHGRPHAIDSDPVLLDRILLNLVGNAIRYTPPGGRVLLAGRRRGTQVRIEVRDTGVGIAPDEQGKVFDEFVRLSHPGCDSGQGLGLGLSVVRRLAGLLGHRIGLQSAPGGGSCFHVDVPLSLSAPPLDALNPAAGSDVSALAGSFIVLVDDDAMVRAAMRAVFANWGCACVDAASATEAIEELKQHLRTPNLLICDHRLAGGGTGPGAVEVLRNALREPALPALVLAGDVGTDEVGAVHATGLILLHKPIGADRLAATLTRLLSDADGGNHALERLQQNRTDTFVALHQPVTPD